MTNPAMEIFRAALQDRPRLRRGLLLTAPLLLYLILSLSLFARAVNWNRFYFGSWNDALLFIWCLHWWPFALSHGLNPFLCKYVWAPAGYNMAWATSVPFFALLAWPVTVLGSPVLSYNILMLSAPALAAWTAWLLAFEVTGSWVASLLGGLLFGFAPFELYLMMNQLNLDSICLIPLVALLCLRRLRGRVGRLKFIILLSLLLTAQLGISIEVMASLCVMIAFGWCIFLLFAPAAERYGYLRLAGDIALSAPLTICLAAPFMYYTVKGFADFPANIHPSWFQMLDLLQFAVPTPVGSFAAALRAIAREFTGFLPDDYAYISLPALLIMVLYFSRHLGQPYARALLAFICLAIVLALGLFLDFDGKYTAFALPWTLLSHVPVIRSISPFRFLIYVALGCAVTAALWCAGPPTRFTRLARPVLAALAVLCVIPAKVTVNRQPWIIQPIFQDQADYRWTRWPIDPFFTPEHIRAALGPMPNVIFLPDPVMGPGMAWQIDAGMGFTQADGYIGYTLVPEQKFHVLGDLEFGPPSLGFTKTFPAFCAAHRVDYILIGPGAPGSIVAAIEALGWAHRVDNGIEVVGVPKEAAAF